MERYKRENLDKNVGKVWKWLEENPGSTISAIEKNANIKKEDILLSIGWLFREDKLVSTRGKKAIKFSLK